MSRRATAAAARARRELLATAFAAGILWTTNAAADPCLAVPDQGPTPVQLKTGRAITGPVVYVGDGDGLCVALSPRREDWVEIRLADFYAPELNGPGGEAAKAALSRLVMGRRVDCVAGRRSFDRIVATCRLDGQPLGELMARRVAQGGRGHPGRP